MYKLLELIEDETRAGTVLVPADTPQASIDIARLKADKVFEAGECEYWYDEFIKQLRKRGVDTLPHYTERVKI